jgi:hypothetical protein
MTKFIPKKVALKSADVLYKIAVAGLLGASLFRFLAGDRGPAADHLGQAEGIVIGDTLPEVTLLHRGTSQREGMPLTALAKARCTFLVFFHSNCPGCRALAGDWNGLSGLSNESSVIPIDWVSFGPDMGAPEFIEEFDLPSSGYYVEDLNDLTRLGVVRWPSLFLVSGDKVLRSATVGGPHQFDTLPSVCGAARWRPIESD